MAIPTVRWAHHEWIAALLEAIIGIDLSVPDEQVVWIHAKRNVTVMTDEHPIRNEAAMEYP